MHHRRARPTLRVLKEDLTSGWDSPSAQRCLAEGKHHELHPLSELPHPIVGKASDSFGSDSDNDNFVGPIASSTELRLLEIKQSQWRGGVWQDGELGVCWLVVAGLAKGDHQDHDDFYKRVEREDKSGDPRRWLPTEADLRLLKQETAARIRTEWELEIQRSVRDVLSTVQTGGSRRFDVSHPVPGKGVFAHIELSVIPVREDSYEADEVVLDIVPESRYAGSDLLWNLTVRALISVSPPEQGWDRFKTSYSNIGEPGAWAERVAQLGHLVETSELAQSEPGAVSHYTHRKHLAGNTINGRAVRALCGAYFVPTRDHETLPECPTCGDRYADLPG